MRFDLLIIPALRSPPVPLPVPRWRHRGRVRDPVHVPTGRRARVAKERELIIMNSTTLAFFETELKWSKRASSSRWAKTRRVSSGPWARLSNLKVVPLPITKLPFLNISIPPSSTSAPALYRGIIPPIMVEAPKRAIKFAANEQYTILYKNLFGIDKMTQSLSILTGVSAGVTEALVIVPFELVKIRLQDKANVRVIGEEEYERGYKAIYSGTWDALTKIVKQEGIFALYNGVESTIWRHALWNGGYFGVIFSVKSALPKAEGQLLINFISGAIGGTVGTIINTPVDVVKTRVQGYKGIGPRKYNWALPSLVTIAREEGMGALYKGFLPKVLRLGPGGGILLVVFEQVSSLIRKHILVEQKQPIPITRNASLPTDHHIYPIPHQLPRMPSSFDTLDPARAHLLPTSNKLEYGTASPPNLVHISTSTSTSTSTTAVEKDSAWWLGLTSKSYAWSVFALLLTFAIATALEYAVLKENLPARTSPCHQTPTHSAGPAGAQCSAERVHRPELRQRARSVRLDLFVPTDLLDTGEHVAQHPGRRAVSILVCAGAGLLGSFLTFNLSLSPSRQCSALGAMNAYFLSYSLGSVFVKRNFGDRIARWNEQLINHRQHMFNYIVVVRIAPFPPNWLANIGAPHLDVPISAFFFGTFFGERRRPVLHPIAGRCGAGSPLIVGRRAALVHAAKRAVFGSRGRRSAGTRICEEVDEVVRWFVE
ncbi:mitochondrial carrier domain-containing protein [Jimgerdemannia flammicorona]|uniref:Mitochondrial carrier domain-containing protein n=1 Tax=Jimgerdemannia flammicorona TaxID=994334 RepID=A0A433QNI1_9FUNG|nr:mitochondrial carrier domain-containing protein [Jimgerdemannia flammicorona]